MRGIVAGNWSHLLSKLPQAIEGLRLVYDAPSGARGEMATSRAGFYILCMCGRVIQAKGPLSYALVDGLNVRDSRLDNYPRRWNGAPSQELLVIRQNPKTGERSLGRPLSLIVGE